MADKWIIRGGLAVLVIATLALVFIVTALTEDANGQELGGTPIYCEHHGYRPEVRWYQNTGHNFYYVAGVTCHPYNDWIMDNLRQITRLESRRPGGAWSTYSRPITSFSWECPWQGEGWCGNVTTQLDRCQLGREGREYRSKQKTIFRGHHRIHEDVTFQKTFVRYRYAPQMWACGSYEP